MVHNTDSDSGRDHRHSVSNPYYQSLTRRMTLIIIIVSFTPLLLVSGVILHQFQTSYQEKIIAHLQELVLKHKQNIDMFLKEKLADIHFLASTHSYEDLRRDDFLDQQLALLQQRMAFVFVDLGVVDDQGNQVAYAGPFKLGKAKYSDAEWFKISMEKQYIISDVFLGLRGLPHFIISVRKDCGHGHCILRSTIDFVAFNNLVERIRIGETGFAFILNKQGDFQTNPTHDVKFSDGPYRKLLSYGAKDKNKVYVIEGRGGDGGKNIYVAAFLKNGNWMLVYQQNKKEVFADLYRARTTAILIFLLGGLCIITMALLLSKRMVDRIAVSDIEKEVMNQQVIESGRLAAIGELAAGIAHEINNPVAIMVEEAGWIQDLLEEEDFTNSENIDEFNRALKQIRNQGKRCKDITHKLLSFARKTGAQIQLLDINDLIEDVVGLSAQRAKYSKVAIRRHLDRKLPLIEASKTELQQVFLNLVNNALDAMEKAGGVIDISSKFNSQNIFVNFSDSGPGISKANLDRIFDPFFTTKPVGKGTGLGLSICYGIVKKMGGDINIDSTADTGASFTIRIPLNQEVASCPADKN